VITYFIGKKLFLNIISIKEVNVAKTVYPLMPLFLFHLKQVCYNRLPFLQIVLLYSFFSFYYLNRLNKAETLLFEQ